MDDLPSGWSDWATDLPDQLQPDYRVAWFDESLTTAPNPSTHFVVSKCCRRYRYFEVKWDNQDEQKRWREIDCEECRDRTSHCARDQPSWYLAFPGYLGLIVNPEKRIVERVGYGASIKLPAMQFDLFHIMYKAGKNGTSKDAVENQYKGGKSAIRQRKAILRSNLIPLSLEIVGWRLIDDGKKIS